MRKLRILIYILVMATTATKAQSHKTVSDTTIYSAVEVAPKFPGGDAAFSKYLSKNLHAGSNSTNEELQTKVTAQFIVEKDGSLSNCHTVRPLSTKLEKEFLKILKASPKWEPGTLNGKKVRVLYVIPIPCMLWAEE